MSEEEAVLRYESLRSRCGVNGRPSQEGGLFVQRGLVAWMHAWASFTGPPPSGMTDAAQVEACVEGLPAGLSVPIIGLVTAMVMTAYGS